MGNSNEQLWQTCLADIEPQLSKANFTTWFKNTGISKEEDGTIYIAVPNEFVREWMITKYHKIILKTIVEHADYIRGIEFIIQPLQQLAAQGGHGQHASLPNMHPSGSARQQQATGGDMGNMELPLAEVYINRDDNLNPRYTFDHFIVGPFNELAHAAAQAVIRRPQSAYNPLFIYGSSGLGKTHLIQAVGNDLKSHYPEKKIIYISLEKFQNDYVASVQNNRPQAFHEKYRKYDVLIMDDIQFISGKEGTQTALFHLFNALYEQGKNIIFSSDKHPNHIVGLEDRLKTRFSAGMTIDIQEPDLESRMAIIKEKCYHLPHTIPDDVLLYVASVATGSIRELEGILNIISMQIEMKQKPVTLAEVKILIKNNVKPKKLISVDSVIKAIADYYNIDDRMMYEKTRRKEIVKARQVIMYILREDFNESYPSIGTKLGGKDHTTVIHSYEKIKAELDQDPMLTKEIEDIRILFK